MNARGNLERRWWLRPLLALQIYFGAVMIVGSVGEFLLAAAPSLLPASVQEAIAASPFLRAHQSMTSIRLWVAGSNVLNLAAAVGLVVSAVRCWRGGDGAALARRSAGWLLVSTVLGQVLMAITLYPRMSDGEIVAVVSSGAGGAMTFAAVWWAWRRRGATIGGASDGAATPGRAIVGT